MKKRFLSNPAPGESLVSGNLELWRPGVVLHLSFLNVVSNLSFLSYLPSGNLVMETGCNMNNNDNSNHSNNNQGGLAMTISIYVVRLMLLLLLIE